MSKPTTIRWVPSPDFSTIHAIYTVASGNRCADPKLESALLGPVTQLNQRLVSASIDVARFWRRMVTETFSDRVEPDDRRLCEIALYAAGTSEMQLEQLATAVANQLSECRLIFANRFPKIVDQLRLRGQPLQQSWNAYGAGLLASVTRQIWQDSPPNDWWLPKVDGHLVQPVRSGDGDYDSYGAQFWIEAVLTDTNPNVPETLRTAWLVTQLSIEAHTRERSGDGTHSLPWQLATVPIVLKAGRDLDLVRGDKLPIEEAMEMWNLGSPSTATIVSTWWSQAEDTSAAIPVALKALGRMLHPDVPIGSV